MNVIKKWWTYSDWRCFLWAITADDTRDIQVVFKSAKFLLDKDIYHYNPKPAPSIVIFLPYVRLVMPESVRMRFLNSHPETLDEIPF
jgi:hypothetical protein